MKEKKWVASKKPVMYQSGDKFIISSHNREQMDCHELLAKLDNCRNQKKLMEEQLDVFQRDIAELEKLEASATKLREIFKVKQKAEIDAIAKGIEDVKGGKVLTSEQLKKKLFEKDAKGKEEA